MTSRAPFLLGAALAVLLGLTAGVVAAHSVVRADCETGLVAVVFVRLVVLPALVVANVVAYGLVFSVVYGGVAQRRGAAAALVATVLCLAALTWPTATLYLADNHTATICVSGAASWWPF